MQKITAIKGMNDILPNQSYIWLWLENVVKEWLISYGYENIRTPIVEDTRLFIRSIGAVTDIVEKEMYSFIDSLNGDSLTLRPEGTAGTIRAVIEHNMLYNASQKLWYIGPMFRHERPQKGRYRQFSQLGVEALGFKGPDIEGEMILMLANLWQLLGLNNLELQINCLGQGPERIKHREALINYFKQHAQLLDDEAKHRLDKNPLRILDSKNPALQDLINQAPRLIEFLGADSLAHYKEWKDLLNELKLPFVENHRLVRGLDYYNLSVFEWISPDLGAQATICGGGRYDPLITELGGQANYAIGFAIGLERILLALNSAQQIPIKPGIDIFIANLGQLSKGYSLKVANLLRNNGYQVIQNFEETSFKSQLKKANNLKAKVAVIIGENEVITQQVMVKFMATQQQELVKLNCLVNKLNDYINSNS